MRPTTPTDGDPASDPPRGLQALLATRARERMAVVSASTLFFMLFVCAVEVILPLWVTRDLGLSASDWAHLRSLRFAGVLVGVIVLGALSDRFGERLLGAISMFGLAALLLLLSYGQGRALWFAMPLYGALVSTAFVNLNTLTQFVSLMRQGLANTIYRGVGALAGVIAPVGATWLAGRWGGYPAVLASLSALLCVGGILLLRYPPEQTVAPVGPFRDEIARLWSGYRTALAERQLMWATHLWQLWYSMVAGVGTFAAIRLTRELGQTDAAFGLLSSGAAVLGLLATVLGGFVLDRLPLRQISAWGMAGASLFCLLMGVGDSVTLAAVGLLGHLPLSGALAAPVSMWVSRAAGGATQSAVFAVQKVIAAAYVAATAALLGLLERWVGIRVTLLWGGFLGLAVSFCFLLLPEPPQPGRVEGPEAG